MRLSEGTLVVTLHEVLSPAEKALARTPEGAAQVQEFHRQLFKSSADSLGQEIQRITGVAAGESGAECERTTGAVMHAFATGTIVQVFQLVRNVPAGSWSGTPCIPRSGSYNSCVWERVGKCPPTELISSDD